MKLRDTNHIELSVANLRALYQAVERGEQSPTIYKTVDGQVIAVSVAQDVEHYSTDQLGGARRRSWLPSAGQACRERAVGGGAHATPGHVVRPLPGPGAVQRRHGEG